MSTRFQCAKCPWKVGVNPHDIPHGYSPARHRALKATISQSPEASLVERRPMMACHETPVGAELPCIGWRVHQLGPGNNLRVRLAVLSGAIDADVETVGPQHARFEDTLPRRPR